MLAGALLLEGATFRLFAASSTMACGVASGA